jgi:hypothetical protein
MGGKHPFDLIYDPEFKSHLQLVEPKYRSLIRSTLEEQLPFSADVETQNRKPLKRPVPFSADWELRFGPGNRFRAFYSVNHERHEMILVALGIKERERITIGGEEVPL